MRKLKKYIIYILIIIIILILLGYIFKDNLSFSENNPETIINKNLLKDIENEPYKISRIDIEKMEDYYVFKFEITNISSYISPIQIISFVFVDENDEIIGNIESEMQPLNPSESATLELRTKKEEYFKAEKIELEIK